jgi:nitroimidazol reductase NimA-like FMN-containing flavoprotein (pyridoxamine 5'-phosphate oxidase superfamily)
VESDGPKKPQEQQALGNIREILNAQRFAVLSTHAEGQPYASLVAFWATEDLRRILFCTPRSTRKYANLCCDGRAAMLFHTSRNAATDCDQAMSVTATGTATEVPEDRKGAEARAFLTKHPELAGFVGAPQNALLVVEVSEYHLVRRFQDVIRIRIESGDEVHHLRPPGRDKA